MKNSIFPLMTAFCFLFAGTALVTNTLVIADESDLIYGTGVHAFFDRDYEGTVKILLQVEDIKNNDPRPLYFLGLAYLRQEKTEEADQYFKKAAQLEYSGRALRDYGVSDALRRIQGEERLQVEKIRSEERTNARIREQQLREARYGSENAAGRDAFRQLAPQTQLEDQAMQKETAGTLGDNAFGVRGMNPIAAEEEVAVKRADANPFGEVVTEEAVEPVVPELIMPVTSRPSASTVSPRATGASGYGSSVMPRGVKQPGKVVSPAAFGMNPTQGTREVAREIGRSLGSLFVRRQSGE